MYLSVLLLLLHVGIVSGNKIVYFEYYVVYRKVLVVTWRLQTSRSHKFNYRKFYEKNWTHRLENARRNERTRPTHKLYYVVSWPIDLYRIVEEKKRWGHQGTSIENSELYFFVHYVTKQIACRIL